MTRNVSAPVSTMGQPREDTPSLANLTSPVILYVFSFFVLGLLAISLFVSSDSVFEPTWLLPLLNGIFLTFMPFLIAILSARSFLNDRSPVLLFFGCSMLVLSMGGPAAGLMTVAVNVNNAMQVWNCTTLVMAVCNLAAALQLFLDANRRLSRTLPWLIGAYTLCVVLILLLILATRFNQIPVFFVAGEGSTPVRQAVLYVATGFFAVSSSLLFIRNTQMRSQFVHYYAMGMVMFAVGLMGTYSLRQTGTIQNWAARLCMYTSGIYIFMGAIAGIRQGRWSIPIDMLHETHLRYERLVAFCPDSIMVHVDGRFVFVNAATVQMLKLNSPGDIIGKPILDFIHPDDREYISARVKRVLSQRNPEALSETRMLRADGTAADVETIAVSVEYEGRPAVLVVARDIAARKRAEEARSAIEHRYRLIFEGMTEGFALHEIIVDDNGNPINYRYIDVNPSFERFTGLRREDVIGKTLLDILPGEDKSWIEIYGRVALTGEPVHFEQRSPALNRFYEVVAYRPAPMQFAVLFLDVSDRKRMEIEMRSARESAESASRAKDEFLARLSHELRTPLTPVLLTVSLLEKRADLPVDLRDDLGTIHQNVLLEARLIDDLLDLTRIAKGKIQFDFQNVDLHTIARNAAAICASGEESRIHLDLRATQTWVHGDSARLQQVIWNLLNNARKFTPAEGSIVLSTSNPRPNILRVAVKDNGIGIREEFLPRVFNAFEQAQGALKHGPGLGLGLAIAKAIVDAHGGTITATSEGSGQGSEFSFELHCRGSDGITEPEPHVAPAPAAEEPKRLKLLLVEDHESTRQVMQKLLKVLGHSVVAADSVQSALEAAENNCFDFVISDIGLPDGNGNDLMIKLRARHHVRGIALSGYGMEEDKQRSIAAGFIAHLTKPVSLDQLETVLRDAMKS